MQYKKIPVTAGMVMHIRDPCSWEAEARGSLQAGSQPVLCYEFKVNLSCNSKTNKQNSHDCEIKNLKKMKTKKKNLRQPGI